jgi:hypothetical protein
MPFNPLEWLGAYTPSVAPLTEEELRKREKRDLEIRTAQPQWRKDLGTLADIATDNPVTNFAKGWFSGSEAPKPGESLSAANWGELANAASDAIPGKMLASKGLALAGMPLAWYRRTGRLKEGLHRAQKGNWDLIEDAALKSSAHGKGVYSFGSKPAAERYRAQWQEEGMPEVGRTRELDAAAQNVLDLVEPNPQDIHKYLRTYPENIQEVHREYFNDLVNRGMTSDEAYKQLAKVMAQAPSGNVEGMVKEGFDALRYPYGGESAWMFPTSTPIYSVDRSTGRLKKSPFNQAALDARRQSISAQPQISVTPETPAGPKVGDVLPSGRRFQEKAAPAPRKHPTEYRPPQARMSLAELMAQKPAGPVMRKVKLPNGKVVEITEEEFLKMRGTRGGG